MSHLKEPKADTLPKADAVNAQSDGLRNSCALEKEGDFKSGFFKIPLSFATSISADDRSLECNVANANISYIPSTSV